MANSGGKDATFKKSKSNSRASLSRSPNRIVVKWSRSATIQRSTRLSPAFCNTSEKRFASGRKPGKSLYAVRTKNGGESEPTWIIGEAYFKTASSLREVF